MDTSAFPDLQNGSLNVFFRKRELGFFFRLKVRDFQSVNIGNLGYFFVSLVSPFSPPKFTPRQRFFEGFFITKNSERFDRLVSYPTRQN